MKQYRGYYIDHVIFNSTAEIDAFIKKQAVEHHNRLSKMFSEHPLPLIPKQKRQQNPK